MMACGVWIKRLLSLHYLPKMQQGTKKYASVLAYIIVDRRQFDWLCHFAHVERAIQAERYDDHVVMIGEQRFECESCVEQLFRASSSILLVVVRKGEEGEHRSLGVLFGHQIERSHGCTTKTIVRIDKHLKALDKPICQLILKCF